MNWLKGPKMAIIWTVLRVWLGVRWLEAGIHKVMDGFDTTGFIHGAIVKAGGENPAVQGWYAAFLEEFALPNIPLFNVLIPWGGVLVGIGLITGAATIPALLAGTAGYYYGADRWIVPALKQVINRKRHNKKEKHHHEHLPVH